MWEKDSDFRPELLWREGKAFLNIEERALAYRKLYMQNADESRTEEKGREGDGGLVAEAPPERALRRKPYEGRGF